MPKFLLRVPRSASDRIGLAACLLAALFLLTTAIADGALVRVGTLVLRADGGFTPQVLPRDSYAPIEFKGWAEVTSTDSKPVPAVEHIKVYLDRDGRLDAGGLPACPPERIADVASRAARSRCAAAIVGTGRVAMEITQPGRKPTRLSTALTLFNGPRVDGRQTVIAHARATFPTVETYVVTIPIERRQGSFAYRATVEIPELAGGYGALSRIEARVGRRYRSGGRERSFLSARCSDAVLETRGRFLFDDGTVIEGNVFKGCTPKP